MANRSNTEYSPRPPFIVRFYGQQGARDGEGRTLDEILNFNDHSLEYHHDFIQVLFPVSNTSHFLLLSHQLT